MAKFSGRCIVMGGGGDFFINTGRFHINRIIMYFCSLYLTIGSSKCMCLPPIFARPKWESLIVFKFDNNSELDDYQMTLKFNNTAIKVACCNHSLLINNQEQIK